MIDPDKERESFISIRELVALIASRTGKTEQKAAAMLMASLNVHPDWSDLLMYEWQPTYGCFELDDNERRIGEARRRLKKWAESGDSQIGFEDLDNEIPF